MDNGLAAIDYCAQQCDGDSGGGEKERGGACGQKMVGGGAAARAVTSMAEAAGLIGGDIAGLFRAAMRRLASTVAIVCARGDDGPVGMAATSITSLSVEPPAVLVCVNRAASLHALLQPGAPLSISLLSHDQREVSAAFGGAVPRERRFGVGVWRDDASGLPALAGAQANMRCVIDALLAYGTHSIAIARVIEVCVSEKVAPLIYQDGAYL